MSSFACDKCGEICSDTGGGYITGCEHYPPDNKTQEDKMDKMTDSQWEFVSGEIDKIMRQIDRFSDATDGLKIAPESPIVEPIYFVKDIAVGALSRLAGDVGDNIGWFVFECDFGRNAKKAGCDGDMRLINNYDMLRWLIDLDCSCSAEQKTDNAE